jgi:hypothetical protein
MLPSWLDERQLHDADVSPALPGGNDSASFEVHCRAPNRSYVTMPHHDIISIQGKVADIFAHRFVVQTKVGKYLADLGPEGAKQVSLEAGDEVVLKGEAKASEIKISEISRNGGAMVHLEHKKKPHEHGPAEPETALNAVRAAGYEILAAPKRKPKHFEVLARKGRTMSELHVELDGHIRKSKPVTADEPKWAQELATHQS